MMEEERERISTDLHDELGTLISTLYLDVELLSMDTGLSAEAEKKILEIKAPIVVYVSCNPATQARDLNLLDEKYSVTKVQPVDMFPHTHHIENVAQLKLRQ